MTGHAVQFVMGSHKRKHTGLFHSCFIRRQIYLAQCTLRYIHRCGIRTIRRFTSGNQMFGTSQSHITPQTVFSLISLNRSHPHSRHQIRVLTECLARTSPTRIARYVNVGRKSPVGTGGTHFQCGFPAQLLYQLQIEAGSLTDRCRIYRCPIYQRITMNRINTYYQRYLQTASHSKFLQQIGFFSGHHMKKRADFALFRHPIQIVNAQVRIESIGIIIFGDLRTLKAFLRFANMFGTYILAHLGNFFFKSHTLHQIVHTLANRLTDIFI